MINVLHVTSCEHFPSVDSMSCDEGTLSMDAGWMIVT